MTHRRAARLFTSVPPRRVLALVTLLVLGVIAVPTSASAASACPTCIGHRDKVGGDYVVKAGDTLSSIAAAHGTSGGAAQLYANNSDVLTSPHRIYVGQRLLVGEATAPAARYQLDFSYNGQFFDRVTIPSGGNVIYIVRPNGSGSGTVARQTYAGPGKVGVASSLQHALNVSLLENGTVVYSNSVGQYHTWEFHVPVQAN